MQIQKLTYTAQAWDKKGCKCFFTSNCKAMCNGIIEALILDYKVDMTKQVKTKEGYEYKNGDTKLILSYPIEFFKDKEH